MIAALIRPHQKFWKEFFPLIFLLLLNAFFLNYNFLRGFIFYDMGVFLDASWRVTIGQKPHIDFYFISGPLHLYMNAFFFKLFGFGKTALVSHLVVASTLAILATYWAARGKMPWTARFLVTTLTMVSFYWPVSHPWYNQSAQLWGLLAAALWMRTIPFQNSRRAFWISALGGALAMISFMTKTNIGFAFLFAFFVMLLFSPQRNRAILGYFLGAILALGIITILFIPDFKLFFEQSFLEYGIGQRGRLLILLNPSYWAQNYYWPIVLFTVLGAFFCFKNNKERVVLFAGFWLIAVISIFTSSLFNLKGEFPLIGIYAALGFILLYDATPANSSWLKNLNHFSKAALTAVCFLLIFVCVQQSVVFGWWRNPEWYNYPLHAAPLRGLRSDQTHIRTLDGLVEFFEKVPKNETLLILTDMQVLYPLTGMEPYRGVPIGFVVDLIPPPGKPLDALKKRLREDPPVWIVTHKRFTQAKELLEIVHYLGFTKQLETNYIFAKEIGTCVVLRRNDFKKELLK